jgi:outer membrane protein insertion porin family
VGKPIKLFTLLFLAWLVSGCLGTRYLQENQKLLYRQTLEVPKGFSKEGLSDLYVKKVNRKLFGLPINSLVWMHQEGKKRYTQQKFIDEKVKVEEKFNRKIAATKNQKKSTSLQYRKQEKIATLDGKIENGNLFMQWGEPVAVFDSVSLDATQEKISDYLFNRGYFHNSISYRTKEFKKRIGVVYEIKPGRPSLYDTIFFQIEDRKIDSIVQSTQSASLIKVE